MVEALCYKSEGRGFDSLEYFIEIILPAALWLWFNSGSIRNDYQEYLLGVKGGRCVRLALTPSCAHCHEMWKPQPPETLRACPDLNRDRFTFFFLSFLYLHFFIPLFCLSFFPFLSVPSSVLFHLSVSSAYFILLLFSFIHSRALSIFTFIFFPLIIVTFLCVTKDALNNVASS